MKRIAVQLFWMAAIRPMGHGFGGLPDKQARTGQQVGKRLVSPSVLCGNMKITGESFDDYCAKTGSEYESGMNR